MINFREGWRGHLWQGRFASFIMEERHLLACTRYIEYNPVRAGLVKRPEDWTWSSAGAHMDEKDDILVKTSPLLELVNIPWGDFLSSDIHTSEIELFRKHERTGRPLGKTTFVKQLETILERRLRPKKPGRKKNR
jgi:putative transposase